MRVRSTAAALALLIVFAVHSPAGAATRSATATAAKVIRTLNAERRAKLYNRERLINRFAELVTAARTQGLGRTDAWR